MSEIDPRLENGVFEQISINRTMTEPSIPFTLNSNSTGIILLSSGLGDFPVLENESTVGVNTINARVINAVTESKELRVSTNNLMVQTGELRSQTDKLTAQTDELRTQTDELKERTDKLSKQIDDLMLTREFDIDLKDCFREYPQFISQKTGDVKHKYRLPIRAYCPSIYWGRGKKDNKFLREIHIKILDMSFCEYPSDYDLDAANDMLRVIINGYKQEKRIRTIAKDDCDGNDYWYFQLHVSENQECIDLAKQIVSKWLQIVYKQPLQDICPMNY